MTQLRLPARSTVRDVFAWRDGGEIYVARADLEALDIRVPGADPRVLLSAVPGLRFEENAAAGAIILNCAASCFAVRELGAVTPRAPIDAAPWGGYLNYDLAAQWVDDGESQFGGIIEGTLFGPLGRVESSWLGDGRLVRLETRWTIDYPDQRLRLQVGDATAPGIGGGVLRFGGVLLGRHFGLTPTLVTHPTPVLSGEAESASTVELYIDGALRARERVEAGPFVLDESPFITGAGEAQLVVTDALGRQQIISRPFFVSADLLRPGLSDWSVAIGAVREEFALTSVNYGAAIAMVRYRVGVTSFLTFESAFEVGEEGSVELGAAFASARFGQIRVSHAQGERGAALSAAWFRDAHTWSFGLQADTRDAAFSTLTRGDGGPLRSAAAHLNFELGDAGALAFTAAAADYADEPSARTLSLAYTPDWFADARVRFRLAYTEREDAELAFGATLNLSLPGDASSSYGVELDDRGATYRAGAQRPAPAYGGFGWRARTVSGAQERFELGANHAGALGETGVQAVRFGDSLAGRFAHNGAVGWIDGRTFAGAPVRGAFALIDVGAPNVAVTRDGLGVGRSGRDGRVLAANLRPYDANTIGIDPDDLPFDRAPPATQVRVTPREGAGVIVRFRHVAERLQETHVRTAAGAAPPRGAVLVRARDGARFPVGSDGRLVLSGALNGDLLTLDGRPQCVANADPASAEIGLTLTCAGGA